jgi:hypothetical protein
MADLLLYAAIKARNEQVDGKLYAKALDFTGEIGPSDSGYASSSTTGISSLWKSSLDAFVGSSQNYSCIWNSNGYFRCGTSCNWCVPTGVTSVTMEMWGPGGSTSSNCCCGGAPWGPNGSFIALKFDVTPGECLCICSGCAYCCYATQTTPGLIGGPSYFTTSNDALGLTLGCIGACAMSGISCYEYWNADATKAGLSAAQNTNMIPPGLLSGDTCGPNYCSGWNYCWDTGDDNVDMPPIFSSYSFPSVTCTSGSVTRNLEVFKIPGTWPCMKIGVNNNNAFTSNAPVPRYEDCICSVQGQGNTCTGCQMGAPSLYGQGFLCGVPGAGGVGGFVYGGCQACGGDSGRLGFVRIGYNCN